MATFSKFNSLVLAAGVAGMATAASAQTTFQGNGATGFGGALGNGSLTIDNDASTPGTIAFSFTPGTTFDANNVVIFVDSIAGGVNSTAPLTDAADGGRTAISGTNGTDRTVASFPTGFGADFAVSLDPGFAGLFNLTPNDNFAFVSAGGLAGTGTGPFTFSFTPEQLGLTSGSGQSFSFVASLISGTAFRSNETIGASVTVPGNEGSAPNAGFGGTTTFSESNNFTLAVVPEPTSLGLLGLGGLALLRRRK